MSGGADFTPPYAMLLAGLGVDAVDPHAPRTSVDSAFLDFLITEFARRLPFDEAYYQAAYADIAAAVARGELADVQAHFLAYGFREGRLPHDPGFDPAWYSAANPDVARPLNRRGMAELWAHYERAGRFEGRPAHAGAVAEAARWGMAVRRTRYELAHRTIDGAFVQGFRAPLLGGADENFRGGLVLGDAPEDRRLRHRRDQPVDRFPVSDEPVGMLSGEYVYGGPYHDHFGHVMAEMIHRVLPSRELFACRQLLFVGCGMQHLMKGVHYAVAGWEAIPPVMQAALAFLDVAPEEVTVIHDDRVVQRLHVVEQGSTLSGGARAEYLAMLSAYTPARLEALHAGGASPARVYVSRSRIVQSGVLLGETWLQNALRAEGWTVLHPEDLPLVEQMQIYYRAEVVMFGEGSACHGVELFGAGNLGHLVLLPRRENHVWLFEGLLKPRARRFDVLPAASFLGSVVANEAGEALEHAGVSLFDIAVLARALRQLGLAQLAGLDPPGYRRAARADLATYRDWHARKGTPQIRGEALEAFEARCAAALG